MQKAGILWVVGIVALVVISAQVFGSISKGATVTVGSANQIGNSLAEAQITPVYSAPVEPESPSFIGPDGRSHTITTLIPDEVELTPELPYAIGIPAIQPNTSNAGPDEPAFTEEDVRRYHETYETHGAGHYPSLIPAKIEKIEFGTIEEFLALGMPVNGLGQPKGTLVCVVQYSGSFIPRTLPGTKASGTLPYALVVFHAHTSNQLMSSVMYELRP